jgi:hypothetical protein
VMSSDEQIGVRTPVPARGCPGCPFPPAVDLRREAARTRPLHSIGAACRGQAQCREVEARYGALLAWSENAAPCGSMAFTIQSPPGTSMGPLRICPPFALMRSIAAVMSGTRK